MELHLPLLAEINLHVGEAEEHCQHEEWSSARISLEEAEAAFEVLRGVWPGLESNERGLMSAIVKPLKARYDKAESLIPKLVVISEGAPEVDAEDDTPPEDLS